MTDNTTLDAAILHVINQQRIEVGAEPLDTLVYIGATRSYVQSIIAKLIEGMDEANDYLGTSHLFHGGFNAALTEIRRRAGLEVES